MIALLFSFISVWALAAPPVNWNYLLEISERHEFYKNNEVIEKPKDTWQILFAVNYLDRSLDLKKDCLLYWVPGEKPGVLKVVSLPPEKKCEEALFSSGKEEWKDLRSLQIDIKEQEILFYLTHANYEVERWEIQILNKFKPSPPGLLNSSKSYKNPKMIMLAPEDSFPLPSKSLAKSEDKRMCHNISDDCRELSPSTCGECEEGWYEIPNGCAQGPKYCGTIECGGKNAPACRRGMRYQRKRKKFDCRTDSSFAYCNRGFSVQCEGALAFCR